MFRASVRARGCVCVYVCVCLCLSVCVCVCVCFGMLLLPVIITCFLGMGRLRAFLQEGPGASVVLHVESGGLLVVPSASVSAPNGFWGVWTFACPSEINQPAVSNKPSALMFSSSPSQQRVVSIY